MKKLIAVIGVVACGFFIYVSFSQVNTRSDYIEACLYITNDAQEDECYNVYPKNHSSNVWVWGIVSTIGLFLSIGLFASDRPEPPKCEEPKQF